MAGRPYIPSLAVIRLVRSLGGNLGSLKLIKANVKFQQAFTKLGENWTVNPLKSCSVLRNLFVGCMFLAQLSLMWTRCAISCSAHRMGMWSRANYRDIRTVWRCTWSVQTIKQESGNVAWKRTHKYQTQWTALARSLMRKAGFRSIGWPDLLHQL